MLKTARCTAAFTCTLLPRNIPQRKHFDKMCPFHTALQSTRCRWLSAHQFGLVLEAHPGTKTSLTPQQQRREFPWKQALLELHSTWRLQAAGVYLGKDL